MVVLDYGSRVSDPIFGSDEISSIINVLKSKVQLDKVVSEKSEEFIVLNKYIIL